MKRYKITGFRVGDNYWWGISVIYPPSRNPWILPNYFLSLPAAFGHIRLLEYLEAEKEYAEKEYAETQSRRQIMARFA